MILGSPGALCLAMACSQRSSLLWKARWHPSKGHSKEAMAGAGGATRWFGGGPFAVGDAGGGDVAWTRPSGRGGEEICTSFRVMNVDHVSLRDCWEAVVMTEEAAASTDGAAASSAGSGDSA